MGSIIESNKELLQIELEAQQARKLAIAKEKLRVAQLTPDELYAEKRDRAAKYNRERKEKENRIKQAKLDQEEEAKLMELWVESEVEGVDKDLLVELAAVRDKL